YYWLFDLNDLLKVKSGQVLSHTVVPYGYGKLPGGYPSNGINPIIGATFDPARSLLYVSLEGGEAVDFGWLPIVAAFKLNVPSYLEVPSPPSAPAELFIQ